MVWEIDPILVRLGPVAIRYYGVCFLIAILGGFFIWRSQVLRSGGTQDDADRIFTPGIIAVLLGARLGHVLFYEPQIFLADPISILYIWRGGLASHGAAIALVFAMLWYSWRLKRPFFDVADRFMIATAWAAAWVRMGNFMNSEIVGRITDVPWGVKFIRYDRDPPHLAPLRHPSQLYEFALGLGVLAALLIADRMMGGEKRKRGVLSMLFMVLYFGGRFVIENFKEYQTLSAGTSPLTMGQYLSLGSFLIGLAGLVYFLKKGARGLDSEQ